MALKVGDFARNVESGWVGKVAELQDDPIHVDDTTTIDRTTAKMVGVDLFALLVGGETPEQALTSDDIRYHDVDDLVPHKFS